MDNQRSPATITDITAARETRAEFNQLLRLADAGDQDALAEVRQVMNDFEGVAENLMDVSRNAELALLDRIIPQSRKGSRAVVDRQLEQMRQSLKMDATGEIDNVLVDQFVIDWLAVQVAQIESCNGGPIEQVAFHQRRLEKAHRQFNRTARTLATVRRLLVPTMQMNFSNQAVNIASMEGDIPAPEKRRRRAS